jgi:hypothetical protein
MVDTRAWDEMRLRRTTIQARKTDETTGLPLRMVVAGAEGTLVWAPACACECGEAVSHGHVYAHGHEIKHLHTLLDLLVGEGTPRKRAERVSDMIRALRAERTSSARLLRSW